MPRTLLHFKGSYLLDKPVSPKLNCAIILLIDAEIIKLICSFEDF